MSNLLSRISDKSVDKTEIAAEIAKKPKMLRETLDGLNNNKASVKYSCAKVIRILYEMNPGVLYSHVEIFINMLDSDKNIFKWEGLHVLSCLAMIS